MAEAVTRVDQSLLLKLGDRLANRLAADLQGLGQHPLAGQRVDPLAAVDVARDARRHLGGEGIVFEKFRRHVAARLAADT